MAHVDATPLARLEDEEVLRASDDAVQRRQAAAARAGLAQLGLVANLVAQQRHDEIVQRRDDDPADLARLAGLA